MGKEKGERKGEPRVVYEIKDFVVPQLIQCSIMYLESTSNKQTFTEVLLAILA